MSQGVSDEEIAREVRTLRNLRRRSGSSTGPGALPLDPDLPPPSPAATDGPIPSYSSNDDITLSSPDGLEGNFWVPAHLHPELAPGEFRAFLKAHTHSDPEHATADEAGEMAGLSRSPSWLSRNGSRRENGLGRKRSMLSRQYQPKIGDDVEEEVPPIPSSLSRQRASIYRGKNGEKGLTLNDLQKLEELVDEAGETDDPDQMRTLLRRSLSMNVAPGFLEDDIPQGEEGRSSLPRPGSILRRSARTKIRKAGLQGDGGGHRFAATRKGRTTAAPVIDIPGLEDDDDPSSSRRYPSEEGHSRYRHGSEESDEALKDSSVDSHDNDDDDGSSEKYHDAPQHIEDYSRRPSDSSTDETHIFDAYARNSRSSSISGESSSFSESPSPEGSPPSLKLDLPPLPRSTSDWFKDGEKTPTQEAAGDPISGYSAGEDVERTPSSRPSALPSLVVPTDQAQDTRRSPTSPTTPKASAIHDLPPGMAPPAQRLSTQSGAAVPPPQQPVKEAASVPLTRTDSAATSVSSSSSVVKEKEKEKKGGFFSKSKDKDKDKKGKKDKDRFLGALFGGSKKKQEESAPVSSFGTAGPAAAAALLGSSKSAKSLGLSPTPSPTSPGFQTNSFARYPIHVERAVYRLSHIKLANARRPLYEQVLISNLMFWYLGVIGRNVAEEKKANGSANASEDEKKGSDKPPAVKGTPPKPIDSGVAGKPLPREAPERVQVRDTAPSGKKMGLTKPDRSRQAGRDAEAPVRSPSYGMQNAQVDSELRNAGIGMKGPRPPSTGAHPQQHPPQLAQHPPHQQQQQQQHQQQHQQQQQPQHNQTPRDPSYPHAQQQPQRSASIPPPAAMHRALSPPGQIQPKPASEYTGPHVSTGPGGPRDPREYRSSSTSPSSASPPYGLPNGHPPGAGQMGQSQSMHDVRDGRQRTYSNPAPPPMQPRELSYSGHPPGPGLSNQGPVRRVVSEVRPPVAYDPRDGHPPPTRTAPPSQIHPQHSGPQPGQIFHHPSSPGFRPASPGFSPGQIPQRLPPSQQPQPALTYGGQPGQIFRPPPGTVRPPVQNNWDAGQRLPPGAGPAGQPFRPPPQQGFGMGNNNSPYAGQPLPQHHQRPPPQSAGGPYYGQQHPGQARSPPPGQGQIPQFSPYAVPPPPQPGRGEDHRRPQPVQQAGSYQHR